MDLLLAVENASSSMDIPDDSDVHRWVTAALEDRYPAAEVSVRIVDEEESARLNQQYRNKAGSTNVLSFTADLPAELTAKLEHLPLGDIPKAVTRHTVQCRDGVHVHSDVRVRL